MTHDEMIAVIAAHRDGKQIQSAANVKNSDFRDWHDTSPTWDFFSCDYRVKPKPVEAWVVVTEDGVMFGVYQYRQNAEATVKKAGLNLRIVHLVEEGGDA